MIQRAGSTLTLMELRSAESEASDTQDSREDDSRHRFYAHFTKHLTACIKRRFSVAESFGVVFDETLQEIPLNENEQRAVYHQLLQWVRDSDDLFPATHRSYSQGKPSELSKLLNAELQIRCR